MSGGPPAGGPARGPREPAAAADPAAAWDAHAADYARVFAPLTGYVGQTMVRMLEARLPTPARLLDIACGPGDLTVAALRHVLAQDSAAGGAQGLVVATDLSPAMLALAERAVAPLGAGPRVRVERRDGQALGLGSASFDAAFSCFGIFLFPDRLAGWREAARVLRPGGWLATAVWCAPEHNDLARLQMAPVLAALPPRLGEVHRAPDWSAIQSAEGLEREVRSAAPWGEVAVSVVHATLAVPTPATMWSAMRGNPMIGTVLEGCTPEERAAVERAALAAFEAMAGGADRPLLLDAACHILIARRR